MILKEIAVERFTLTCAGCARTWTVDYDVQHVEDGRGHEHDYFSHNSLPCVDPTSPQAVTCPTCRTTRVRARLTARRTTPAVDADTSALPPTKPSAQLEADRDQVPLLPGDPASH